MPLKAAICDDEPEQAGMLERYIKEWAVSSDIKIETRIFPSAEAFRFVWEEEKDWWLILLDIQMEGEDGVSLAKYLRGEDEKLQILFITALPDYIEEGYDVSALHYLIKPIRRDKFFQCLDKAAKKEEEESYLLLTTVQGEKVRAAQKRLCIWKPLPIRFRFIRRKRFWRFGAELIHWRSNWREKILSGAIAPISWDWLMPRE